MTKQGVSHACAWSRMGVSAVGLVLITAGAGGAAGGLAGCLSKRSAPQGRASSDQRASGIGKDGREEKERGGGEGVAAHASAAAAPQETTIRGEAAARDSEDKSYRSPSALEPKAGLPSQGSGAAKGIPRSAARVYRDSEPGPARAPMAMLEGDHSFPRPPAWPPPTPRLDPNARYATTYRPGGAALAAFDAALGRGAIPAAYKDLVGDFGGRYASPLAKPSTTSSTSMAFHIDTERAALPPSGGFVNVRVSMRGSDAMPPRAPLSVHLVLDVSGSMAGVAIDNARLAAEALVRRLEPKDDFSMVTFSNDARVLVDDGAIGPRRETVIETIRHIAAGGGTNISAGLGLGYMQAHTRSISADAVKIVMLLSDGHANAGDTDPRSLGERSARAFRDGIQTSTFGLGQDFDAALMSAVGERGAGGYYYLADSSQIASALAQELDARLLPVAQAVEVRIRLRPDVAVTRVYGSHVLDAATASAVRAQEVAVDELAQKKDGIARDRKEDAAGGMRFFMPAFSRDDRHAMLLTLAVPAGAADRPLGSLEVRYKDRLHKKNVTEEIPFRIGYAADEAASAKTANASVVAAAQAFAAGDAIVEAAEAVDRGVRAVATRVLSERIDLLKRAAVQLGEPRLDEDAGRLARLLGAVSGEHPVQDSLPLAVLLRGSAYGYLH